MTWSDKKKAREYNHRYYIEHADELNAKRKKRYHTDPKYRKDAIEAAIRNRALRNAKAKAK